MPPSSDIASVLNQLPVVGVVLVAVWVVLQWTDRRHLAELAREVARTDAADRRAEAERGAAREAARQLAECMGGEITRLRAQNTRLQNPRKPGRRPRPRGDQP